MRSTVRSFAFAATVAAGCGAAAPASAVSVTFTDFSSTAGLQINGDASTANTGDGAVLRLTPALGGQSGSAFSLTQINAASFSTYFEFRITGRGGLGNGADGLVFVVQTVSNTAGGAGGGIGYQGLTPSVGVEFDTFDNSEGSSNHLGINQNGSMNSLAKLHVGTDFDDGNKWFAWVDYDGTTLEVRANQTGVRSAAADLSLGMNISAILGQNNAFIGFTSGTGAGYGNHDIIAWQYRDSFSPGNIIVSEPGMLGLLGLGLIGLGLRRRKA